MTDIEFYDVKKRAKVTVPVAQVKKKKYVTKTSKGKTQVRHAVKAEVDGSKLTKFVSKDVYDSLDVPEME